MFNGLNFKNLSIRVKLALIVAAPIIVLFYFVVTGLVAESKAVSEASHLRQLAEFSVIVGDFVHEAQKERGRTAAFLDREGTVFAAELQTQRADTDERIKVLREFVARSGDDFGEELNVRLDAALAQLDRLDGIRNNVDRLNISSLDTTEFYTNMNILFLDVVGLIPALSSDGEIADLAAGNAIFLRAKDKADLERTLLAQAFATNAFGRGEFLQFDAIVAEKESLTEAFLKIVPQETADMYDSTVQGETVDEVRRLRKIAFDRGYQGDFGVDPDYWFNVATGKLDLLKEVEDSIAGTLINKTHESQRQARSNLIFLSVFGVTAIIVALGLAFLVSHGIAVQVNALTELLGGIGIGNLEARAEVTSGDELGAMATSLNAMLDSILSLIQTREERDAMQASVMKLLDEVGSVAEGDLTAEAEVTADITGAIADAFNYMIGQLRQIVSGVQDATFQVNSSASEIQVTAEQLAQGSEAQATQISDTAAAIEEMAVSIQQVSENAALSATVGEQALVSAHQGAKAVREIIEEMNRIRERVQATARRIERLGESSQEIGEIVRLIGDIADRTSILALNASIQAARAGEAGRGFAVVAEEVERLAERSTEAAKQIDALIRAIQSETGEAVAAMGATTHEVVAGSELADQAGQALADIEIVSNRLAELIQSISLAAKQQARGSEALANSMDGISGITQQTAAGARQAAVSMSTLTILADELHASVSAFRLPAGSDRGII